MSQSVGATHTTTVGEARTRTLVTAALLIAVALIMIAASVYVVLGEKKIAVSPSLWSAALDLCRAVTGLSGVLVIASVVTERRSGSRGEGTLRSVAVGAFLIAGAVAGLGVVIAINRSRRDRPPVRGRYDVSVTGGHARVG